MLLARIAFATQPTARLGCSPSPSSLSLQIASIVRRVAGLTDGPAA
jgi:hypothetical protein